MIDLSFTFILHFLFDLYFPIFFWHKNKIKIEMRHLCQVSQTQTETD